MTGEKKVIKGIEYIPWHKLLMAFSQKQEWGVEENSEWILKGVLTGRRKKPEREREREFLAMVGDKLEKNRFRYWKSSWRIDNDNSIVR